MGMGMEKGMTAYEAARERTVEENKRKMEALNLRHLSAAIAVAPKTPSPMVTNSCCHRALHSNRLLLLARCSIRSLI
jgi:hypothetical protein